VRQREKKKTPRTRSERHCICYYSRGQRKFTALKVLREFPLVLLIEVDWRQGEGKWTVGSMQQREGAGHLA
jgi:hypothetical protein